MSSETIAKKLGLSVEQVERIKGALHIAYIALTGAPVPLDQGAEAAEALRNTYPEIFGPRYAKEPPWALATLLAKLQLKDESPIAIMRVIEADCDDVLEKLRNEFGRKFDA